MAQRVLRGVAVAWVLVAIVGLWAFAFYIAALYGLGAVRGDLERWNTVVPDGHGYVPGDAPGNIAFGLHLLLALMVAVGGALQLVPAIRRRRPGFHRWNGRVFISVAVVASLSGLFIAFSRGAVAGPYMTAGNVLDALLIVAFGVTAWRRARAGDIASHRRWALRAFVVINAIWFYRIGMMFWFLVNQGPVGHTRDFRGPFDIFLAFGHVLVPLACMELYLRADRSDAPLAKLSTAAGLGLLTLVTAVGVFAAIVGMWLPRL